MKAAVLGSPVGHSLSPLLHRAAYDALGLDWSYDAVEVDERGLEAFLDRLDDEWAGISLTMPLKQVVLPLLDEAEPLVRTTASANTVVLREGRRHGHNTDVHGIAAALREAGVEHVDRAAVIGAGATAASALAALHELGAHDVRVLARSLARAQAALEPVADALGVRLRHADLHPLELEDRWPQVVVSTTPAGSTDELAAGSDPSGEPPVLLDVVYAPWPTALAQVYARAGGVVVPGTAMLLHQACEQVRLVTGQEPPVEAMRAALDAR